MKTDTVAAEVAEAEFDRFVDLMDLDIEPGDNAEDKQALAENRARVIKAIRTGRMLINGAGEPEFAPKKGDVLTFREPTGAALMAMDRVKKGSEVGKMFALAGAVTGQHPSAFSKMAHSDVKVCMAVLALFLA